MTLSPPGAVRRSSPSRPDRAPFLQEHVMNSSPEQTYRPELITQGPAWAALHAGVRAAVSAYVTRLRPFPPALDPLRRDPAELRARYLLTVATERAAAEHLDRLSISAGQWAIHHGATPEQLAAVDGTTPA